MCAASIASVRSCHRSEDHHNTKTEPGLPVNVPGRIVVFSRSGLRDSPTTKCYDESRPKSKGYRSGEAWDGLEYRQKNSVLLLCISRISPVPAVIFLFCPKSLEWA